VTTENFSYRYFAKKAGIGSASYMHLIISGNRNLSKDYVPKFSSALGLTKKEQQYFDALVSFNQAKTPEAKRYYLELIHNLKKSKIGTPLTAAQYEYISKWYYPVIRELVLLPDFSEESSWIRARLNNKISSKNAADAVESLLVLGFLKRDENGKLTQVEANITTDEEVKDVAAINFHQQMLSLANEIIFAADQDKREVSGMTIAVSHRQFKDIQTRVREFQDSIAHYMVNNPDTPETVIQLQTLVFPVVSAEKDNGGSK
jgi:uncharacterized protein (TIGR02147 family)